MNSVIPGRKRIYASRVVIVSHSTKILAIHIQKTGGTSLNSLLRTSLPDAAHLEGLRRHATLRQALAAHPEVADYWIFGFVRNPWTRMLSWYQMIKRAESDLAEGVDSDLAQQLPSSPFWNRVLASYPDFESFVMRGTEEIPQLRRPQIRYLRAPGREADFIGRQETYDEDVRRVLDRIGLEAPVAIPHKNAGPTRDHRDAYTRQSRRRVGQVFRRDIRRFDYSF